MEQDHGPGPSGEGLKGHTKFSGVFFESRGGEPETELLQDMYLLADFCNLLYEDFGIKKVSVQFSRFYGVISSVPGGLTRNFDAPNPSPFKRAAVFTMAFMVTSPLNLPFSGGNLPPDLTSIINHQNAIAAFEYARRALCGARIYKKNPDKEEILGEAIRVSGHFYCDTIHAIAQIRKPSSELDSGTFMPLFPA